MSFHVGQKVVCVDDDFDDGTMLVPTNLPKKGQVYTLRDPISNERWTWWRVAEISNAPMKTVCGMVEPAFAPQHFRPVIERSTEAGMATLRKAADDASKRQNLIVNA